MPRIVRRTMRRNTRAAFTLIEILVVITIIAALIGIGVPVYQNAQDKAETLQCKMNLRQIQQNLTLWRGRGGVAGRQGPWPREAGIQFLLVLARDNMVTGKDTSVFLCPGTDDVNTSPTDPEAGSAYAEWDQLDPMTISYAGRDGKNFPVNRQKENEEVIAADDNDGRNNHRYATNFVYADGSVATFDIDKTPRERGLVVDEGLGYIPVGPDSPFEELQKLRVD